MKTILILASITLAGCASPQNSPYYAQCAAEVQLPEHWYSVGTVKAELLDMCIQAKSKSK